MVATPYRNWLWGAAMFKTSFGVLVAVFLFGACNAARSQANEPSPMVKPPRFLVFFDRDSFNLSENALSTVAQVVAVYKTKDGTRISSIGYADKWGSEDYNIVLSIRRANAIKQVLLREGVPEKEISVVGRGTAMPLAEAADGRREQQNRCVEILIE